MAVGIQVKFVNCSWLIQTISDLPILQVEELDRDGTQEGTTARQEISTSSRKYRRAKTGQSDARTRYHVTGRINDIYSEIVLGQICGKGRR